MSQKTKRASKRTSPSLLTDSDEDVAAGGPCNIRMNVISPTASDVNIEIQQPVNVTASASKKTNQKIWFEPIDDESLYYQVFQCSCESMVNAALTLCETYQEQDLEKIIKFFISVAGYQNFEIREFEPTLQGDLKLVRSLTNNVPKMLHDGHYLFLSDKKNSEKCKIFTHHLIKTFYEHELLDETFLDRIVGILREMSISQVRSLVHTGLILLMTVQLALLEILAESRTSQYQIDSTNLIRTYKEQIDRTYLRQCDIADDFLASMKVDCANIYLSWLKINPGSYFKVDFFKKLLNYLTDPNKDVRCKAIDVCTQIIESFPPSLWSRFNIHNRIEECLTDVNTNVCTAALACLSVAENLESNHVVSKEYYNLIIHFLFAKDYYQAYAAANYFIVRYKGASDHEIFTMIIQLNETFPKHTAYLVESFIDVYKPMTQFAAVFQFLETAGYLSSEQRLSLLKLICESVRQSVNGKSETYRTHSRKFKITPGISLKITEVVVKHLKSILEDFENNMDALVDIIEMLKCLQYEDLEEKAVEDLLESILILQGVYLSNKSNKVLSKISYYYSILLDVPEEKHPDIHKGIKETIKNIFNIVSKPITTEVQIESEEDLHQVETMWKQLYNLMLCHKIDDIRFDDILECIDDEHNTPKIAKYISKCCIEDIYFHPEDLQANPEHRQRIFEFFNKPLKSEQSKDAINAFNVIQKLLSLYNLQGYTGLEFDVATMNNFLKAHIFNAKSSVSLVKRRKLLHTYMYSIVQGIFILELLNTVILHIHYNDFQDQIIKALLALHTFDSNLLDGCIWSSFKAKYLEMEEESNDKQKKKINDDFLNCSETLCDSLPSHNWFKIIQNAIVFASENHTQIFKYTQCFCKKIKKPEDRKELLKLIKNKHLNSEKYKKDKQVKEFIQAVQHRQEKKKDGKKNKKRGLPVDSDNEYTIEEAD